MGHVREGGLVLPEEGGESASRSRGASRRVGRGEVPAPVLVVMGRRRRPQPTRRLRRLRQRWRRERRREPRS